MPTNFPKGQNVTISAGLLPGVAWSSASLSWDEDLENTTGTADAGAVWTGGYPTREIVANGWLIDASQNRALMQNAAITVNSLPVKLWDWSLEMVWPLTNDTGTADTEQSWIWGMPILHGTIRGRINPTGPTLSLQSAAYSASIPVLGTIAATAYFNEKTAQFRKVGGGEIAFASPLVMGGVVAHTINNGVPTGVPDFRTAVSGVVASPLQGQITYVLDTGETVTNNALAYRYRCEFHKQRGGAAPITAYFRLSD